MKFRDFFNESEYEAAARHHSQQIKARKKKNLSKDNFIKYDGKKYFVVEKFEDYLGLHADEDNEIYAFFKDEKLKGFRTFDYNRSPREISYNPKNWDKKLAKDIQIAYEKAPFTDD